MSSTRSFSLYVLSSLALLAACQAPRVNTAPEALSTTRELRQEPLRAAACIARNVDRHRSPYSAQIRPANAPAIAEVVMRGSDTVAVATLFAAGAASVAEIHRTSDPAFGLDELIEAMVEGC